MQASPMSSKVKRASVEFIKLYCGCRLPGAFLLLRLFSMKFTVISNTYSLHHAISGLLEPAWIATRKLFILHNAMVPTAQQLNS